MVLGGFLALIFGGAIGFIIGRKTVPEIMRYEVRYNNSNIPEGTFFPEYIIVLIVIIIIIFIIVILTLKNQKKSLFDFLFKDNVDIEQENNPFGKEDSFFSESNKISDDSLKSENESGMELFDSIDKESDFKILPIKNNSEKEDKIDKIDKVDKLEKISTIDNDIKVGKQQEVLKVDKKKDNLLKDNCINKKDKKRTRLPRLKRSKQKEQKGRTKKVKTSACQLKK